MRCPVIVFDGGTLSPDAVDALQITDDQESAFQFCTRDEATGLLRPYVWQRTATALDALRSGRARYMHRGVPTA
jgi:8-oxo-dGTP diphosphatase